jgi:hypothetical protein
VKIGEKVADCYREKEYTEIKKRKKVKQIRRKVYGYIDV